MSAIASTARPARRRRRIVIGGAVGLVQLLAGVAVAAFFIFARVNGSVSSAQLDVRWNGPAVNPTAPPVVAPDGEEWAEVVPALLAARLNLPDAAEAPRRWADSVAVLRLDPTGELVAAGDTLPTGSQATPPPDSPARTRTTLPYTVGRRRRRR